MKTVLKRKNYSIFKMKNLVSGSGFKFVITPNNGYKSIEISLEKDTICISDFTYTDIVFCKSNKLSIDLNLFDKFEILNGLTPIKFIYYLAKLSQDRKELGNYISNLRQYQYKNMLY